MSTTVVPTSYEISLVATPDQEDDVLEVSDFDDCRHAAIFFWDPVNKIELPHPGFLWAGLVTTRAGELRFEEVLPDGSRALRAYHRNTYGKRHRVKKLGGGNPKRMTFLEFSIC